MLNFRVQKVCEMIGISAMDYLNEKANSSIPLFANVPNFTEDVKLEISSMVTLFSFYYLAQNKKLEPKKALGQSIKITDSIFLNPYAVVTCLEKIPAKLKDKICFFEWYIEEWVKFYNTQDKDYFFILNSLYIIAGSAYMISAIDRFFLMQISNEILEETVKHSTVEFKKIFDLFCAIAKKMILDQNRLHIPYAKQFHNLKFLDINMDFVRKINEIDILKEENTPVEKNKEDRNLSELKRTASVVAKDILKKEDKEIYFKQMAKYMVNEEFVGIIEGKELQEFLDIAAKLYSSTQVHLLKDKVLINNSKLKMERRRTAIEKIIHEEDREYYDYLCSIDLNESTYLPFTSFISNTLYIINTYIEDMEKNPDEELALLYLEDTKYLFDNIRCCLSYQKREC